MAIMSAVGCGPSHDQAINGFASGDLIIRTQADSTHDFSGFEVLVAGSVAGDIDTLGIAHTDVEGHFEMDLRAPVAGVYPLLVSRAGTRMAVDEIMVVEGDSARISGRFPLGARKLRIISPENGAWNAYKNAKSFYNKELVAMLEKSGYSDADMKRLVMQSSTILWSLRDSYPNAIGTQIALVESVAMLGEWNDSLAVKRAGEIDVKNPNIARAVRAARRSVARLSGQDSSISFIRRYIDLVSDSNRQAELEAELVIAHTDSLESEEALEAALDLRRNHAGSKWAEWAATATYELENLMPGMSAPPFRVVSRNNRVLNLEHYKGRFLILEFYEPGNDVFQREIETRNLLISALDERLFETLSVSVEPDSVVNEALFDASAPTGTFVFSEGGFDSTIADAYNINVTPTRFLIGPDGKIISKYSGPAMGALERDLVGIVTEINRKAVRSK